MSRNDFNKKKINQLSKYELPKLKKLTEAERARLVKTRNISTSEGATGAGGRFSILSPFVDIKNILINPKEYGVSYIFVRGGRGSGKTENIVRCLALASMTRSVKGVFYRHDQQAVGDSIWSTFWRCIDEAGCEITASPVRNGWRKTNVAISFFDYEAQIRSSFTKKGANNQVSSARAIDNANIAIYEEAQEMIETFFDENLISIRGENAVLIFIYNPTCDGESAVEKLAKKYEFATDALFLTVNFNSNPYFGNKPHLVNTFKMKFQLALVDQNARAKLLNEYYGLSVGYGDSGVYVGRFTTIPSIGDLTLQTMTEHNKPFFEAMERANRRHINKDKSSGSFFIDNDIPIPMCECLYGDVLFGIDWGGGGSSPHAIVRAVIWAEDKFNIASNNIDGINEASDTIGRRWLIITHSNYVHNKHPASNDFRLLAKHWMDTIPGFNPNLIKKHQLYADSNNQIAINTFRDMGFNILPVTKVFDKVRDYGENVQKIGYVSGTVNYIRNFCFPNKNGTLSPAIIIHERNAELKREFELYKWASKRGSNGEEILTDTPKKENDHGLDALRYALTMPYFTRDGIISRH